MLHAVSGGHRGARGLAPTSRQERNPALVSDQPPVPPVPPQGPGGQQQPGGAPQWSAQPGSVPQQPGAVPHQVPATGQQPDAFGRLLGSITGRDWLAAALAPVAGWIAAYVVAAISLLLTVAVAAAGSSGSSGGSGLGSGSGSDLGTAAPDVESLLSGVSVLLGAPAQLVALANLGRLHGSGTVLLLGSGSGSVGVVPALVLAAQVVIAVVLLRKLRSRSLRAPQLLVTSVVSGVVLTALTTLSALVLAIRFPQVSGVTIDPVHAVGVGSVLGSLLIGTATALLARPTALAPRSVLVGRVLGTARIAASQLGVLVVVLVLAFIVIALVAQPEWGAALPLLIGNAAVAFTAIGFFGAVGASGFGSGSSSASVFGGAGALPWLVVLLVLVTAFLAGLALAVRRNDRVRTALDWVVTPAVWFVAGIVVFVLGTMVVSFSVSGSSTIGGNGSIGVAPWTPVVFALWGAAIEVVARFVAPALLPRLGGRALLVTSRLVGTDPRPVPAAAWSGPAPTAPAVPGAQPGTATGAPGTAAAAAAPTGAVPPAAPTGAVPPVAPAGTAGPFEPAVGAPGAPTDPAAAAWQQDAAGTPPQTADAWGQQPAGAWQQQSQPFVGGGAPAPAPMSPRAKKILVRSLVAGGVVVVLVVAGAVTTGVLRSNVWGPAPTVAAYVEAIQQGDAAKAERLSEVPADAAMLDAAVLRSADDRPTDVRVGRVSTSGDRALATVTYQQGGKNRSGQVELRKTGTSFLVKDDWRVTEPLAETVSLYASDVLEGAKVTVGGKEVGEITDGRYTSLAYPGTYEIEVGGTKYFTGGTKKVTVGSSTTPYVDFQPKATKALEEDATQFVTDLIDSCAAKTEVSALSGCPWYGPYDADGAVKYEVKTMPELQVEASGSGGIIVESTKDGVIGYDYTSFLGDSGHQEDTFDVYEYLKVEDGKLVSAY